MEKCNGTSQRLCNLEKCKECFNKSFASHQKSEFWSYDRNDKKPRDVFMGSSAKYWFKCNVCNHDFNSGLDSITNKKRNTWCPYCSNQKLCTDLDCDDCLNKSFASHPKSKFWSSDYNDKKPRDVFMSCNSKFWFKCNVCNHDFNTALHNITNGRWCPVCKNKTEKKLYEWLIENGFTVSRQPKFDWCKNLSTDRHLPFDFLVNDIIIELDGRQHFEQISNWQSHLITQRNDRYKECLALKNGYSIIRLLQEEVWEDKDVEEWKDLLLTSLKENRPKVDITLISAVENWPGLDVTDWENPDDTFDRGVGAVKIEYNFKMKFHNT